MVWSVGSQWAFAHAQTNITVAEVVKQVEPHFTWSANKFYGAPKAY